MDIDPAAYPAATAHDPIVEVFPNVFMVRGSMQMNALMRFNRNMVIVREGADLTVLNSVRLSPEGERQLDALGKVHHVIRLGYFHGRDDRYYVDRYQADFWAPTGSRGDPGPAPDHELSEAMQLPFADAEVFLFREARHPEAAVLLKREGGILITCDCLQNYADRRFCSPLARLMMPVMGFPLKMLIGLLWKKALTKKGGSLKPDFERLAGLDFKHLISGHGSLKHGGAKSAVREAIATAFAGESSSTPTI